MEQKIGPHTTLSIVPKSSPPRPGFAKRSGGGGPQLAFPRPGSVGLTQIRISSSSPRVGGGIVRLPPPHPPSMPTPLHINRMPPPRSYPPSIMTNVVVPELESMYLVTLLEAENRIKIFLSPGKEDNHNKEMSKAIIAILEERGLYNKKMNASVHRGLQQVVYDKLVIGGSPIIWTHPSSRRKTTFIVKRVQNSANKPGASISSAFFPHQYPPSGASQPQPQQQAPRGRGRPPKQQILARPLPLLPPPSTTGRGTAKHVEIIDIDSDEDEEEESEEEEEDEENINDNLFVLHKPASKNSSIPSTITKPIVQTLAKSSASNKQIPPPVNTRKISPLASEPLTQTQGKMTTAPTPPTKVERNVSVVRGKYFGFPSKSIIPPSKSLSCHYRIPDLKKFNIANTQAKRKLGIEVHPFLGERFIVFWNDSPLPPPPTQKSAVAAAGSTRDKRKTLEEPEILKPAPSKRSRNASSTSSSISEPRLTNRRGDRAQPLAAATSKNKSSLISSSSLTTSSRNSSRLQPPAPSNSRQKLREIRPSPSGSSAEDDNSGASSSGSSDSSSSSSGSGSDSENSASDAELNVPDDGRRRSRRAAVVNKKGKTSKGKKNRNKSSSDEEEAEPWDLNHELFKPPPKCFIQAKPCRPLRKSGDGKIYFSLKAKVGPSEHYKNEDLFVNWEKYVRTESGAGGYYKTLLQISAHNTLFAIYHIERDQEKLVMDRIVEMSSDGTIKIRLQGVDVTAHFMKYINIDTNTHLSCLLSNLLNSHICPGCTNFPLVSVYPEACLRDGIWTSRNCSGLVFHPADKFITPSAASSSSSHNSTNNKQPINTQLLTTLCPACKELKIRLEEETWELIKLSREYKMRMEAQKKIGVGRGRGRNKDINKKEPLIFGSYKPPSPPPDDKNNKKQVRESLSNLFLDFWKELGFKEEEFPKETKDLKVDTVTEKDFPIIPENPPVPLIPGLLPGSSLPESIPILENIDFDENGQTMLTFSEVALNPYESLQMNGAGNANINIEFMNSSCNLGPIPGDVIDSLMNSEQDPDGLVQALAGFSQNNNLQNSTTTTPFSNNSQIHQDQHQHQYSYDQEHQLLQQEYGGHPRPPQEQNNDDYSSQLRLEYPTGMEPHNIIDFEAGLDFNLNDDSGVESSLMFPTFSLTEL